MELKILTGAVFAIHVHAERPWRDLSVEQRDSLAKRLVTVGISACPSPPPMHLRMLTEQQDTEDGGWWQLWVHTGQKDFIFNGFEDEPCPLLTLDQQDIEADAP